jgi:hypothetical protein
MANRTIEDLLAAGTITDDDLTMLVQAGGSRKVTIGALKAALAGLFSGASYVAPFRGVLLARTSELTNFATPPLIVPWEEAAYNTSGFWNLSQPTRITIPPGVSLARLSMSLAITASGTAHGAFASVTKNSITEFLGSTAFSIRQGGTGFISNIYNSQTAIIPVVAGDFFECRLNLSGQAPTMNDILVSYSWFSLEVIEGDPVLL